MQPRLWCGVTGGRDLNYGPISAPASQLLSHSSKAWTEETEQLEETVRQLVVALNDGQLERLARRCVQYTALLSLALTACSFPVFDALSESCTTCSPVLCVPYTALSVL